MSAPKGHQWAAVEREGASTKINVVMHHVGDTVAPLPPVSAQVCECLHCGLLLARHGDSEDALVKAFGVDLDSLAIMGSAPRCDPKAFAMGAP